MKIVDVRTGVFRYKSNVARDLEGHTHPGPERDAAQTLVKIITDEGAEGYCFDGDKQAIEHLVKPALVGEDPFYREKIFFFIQSLPGGLPTEFSYFLKYYLTGLKEQTTSYRQARTLLPE